MTGMTENEIAEARRLQVHAETLRDNEIFQRMFTEMEEALVGQMKGTAPDHPNFIQLGYHLQALDAMKQYVQSYIDDGLQAEDYLKQIARLN